jgi:hypothetical protein
MCAHPVTRSLCPYAFRRVHFMLISGLGCALIRLGNPGYEKGSQAVPQTRHTRVTEVPESAQNDLDT